MESSDLLLVYWAIRGRGMPIRFLLEYCEAKYSQKIYEFTPEKKGEWFDNDKQKVVCDFPNLPYLQDNKQGKMVISESLAILSYIPEVCNKQYLIGETPQQRGKIQQAMNRVNDFRIIVRNQAFEKDYEKIKPETLAKTEIFLKQFENLYLKQDWLCGSQISIADFYLYEVILAFRAQYPDEEAKYPNLLKMQKNFESIPQIHKYLRTEEYKACNSFFPGFATNSGIEFVKKYNEQFK